MFMHTSLAQHQLALFGVKIPALATEIGADQRSIFLRPISAPGETQTGLPPNSVILDRVAGTGTDYGAWSARTKAYHDAAEAGSTSQGASAGSETNTAPADETTGPSE